jgi:HEAT repeat protein
MKSFIRAALAIALASAAVLGVQAQATAQPGSAKGGEKTVEEAYLQESIETMIIKEQAASDTKEMKLVALQYAKQAIDAGRKNEDMRAALEYLALESTMVQVRSGGYGRPTNNYPDIRAKACDYLGEFPTASSKDALIKVALSDNEPMVLSAAMRSLGKIGMNDNDEVTQVIAFIVNRFDILAPDNSLAFDSLVALGRIAEKNNGIKDPAAIRAIIRIQSGNYITPVKKMAEQTMDKIRQYQAGSSSGSKK